MSQNKQKDPLRKQRFTLFEKIDMVVIFSIIVIALILITIIFIKSRNKCRYKEIRFYVCSGLSSYIADEADIFNKEDHNGYKVVLVNKSSYDELKTYVKQDMAMHYQPDLAMCYTDHLAEYVFRKNILYDFSQIMDSNSSSWLKRDLFNDKYINENDFAINPLINGSKLNKELKGHYFMLPLGRSTEAMYININHINMCNKLILENNKQNSNKDRLILLPTGLKDNNSFDYWTWDDLWEYSRLLKKYLNKDNLSFKDKLQEYIPCGFTYDANLSIQLFEQNNSGYTSIKGGEYFNFNTKQNVELCNDLKEKYKEKLFNSDLVRGIPTAYYFKEGLISIAIASTANASEFQYDDSKLNHISCSCHIPVKSKEFKDGTNDYEKYRQMHCVTQGPSICMFRQHGISDNIFEEKKEYILKFLSRLYTKEFQQKVYDKGYYPVVKDFSFNKQNNIKNVYQSFRDIYSTNNNILEIDYNKFPTTKEYSLNDLNLFTCYSASDTQFISPAFIGANLSRFYAGRIIKDLLEKLNKDAKEILDYYQDRALIDIDIDTQKICCKAFSIIVNKQEKDYNEIIRKFKEE